jgi:phosphopantetheinyl transferase (holo-ACP synthase)
VAYRFLNYGPQFFDNSGNVLAGGKLRFKQSGSDTLQNTFQESAMTTANTNPIVLDANGRSAVNIFLNGTYRVELLDSSDTLIWQRDPVQNPVAAGVTLADALSNGNTSQGTDLEMTAGQKIKTNLIEETTSASGVTIDGVLVKDGGVTLSAGGAFNTLDADLSSVSANDDSVASAKAIKSYVDSQVTAQDLDFQGDSGGAQSIDLDSQSLTVEGGAGIDTTGSAQKVSIAVDSTVATLAGSQALTNKTINVDSNTLSNVEVDNLKAGVLDTDLASVSASDDTLPSAKAVKTYVDAQTTAQDLDFQGDSGGAQSIDLDSQSLTVEGGTGIDTTGSAQKVSIAVDSTIATLAGSQSLTNKTIDVDNNTLSNVELDNLKSGVLDTDLSSVSASDDTIASAKAIKTYVDGQVTGQDLDFQGDSGGAQSVDLDSQSLTVAGGTGIDSTGSAQTITLAIDATVATLAGSQTLTNKTLTTPTITTPVINSGAQLKNGATSAGFLEFFEDSDNGTNKVTLIGPASTADVTVTIPAATDTLVGKATTDTLTNKTLDIDNNTLSNVEVDNFKSGVLDTNISSVSSSDDTLASAKAIKTYVDSQVAGGGGAYNDFTQKTSAYTASSKDQIIVNSASSVTITLPASPGANENVLIHAAGAGAVVVGRNGSNILGLAEDGTLASGDSTQLVYVDATIGWTQL